jgi:hypothetical protein
MLIAARSSQDLALLLTIVRIATHVFALEAQGTALRGQWIRPSHQFYP